MVDLSSSRTVSHNQMVQNLLTMNHLVVTNIISHGKIHPFLRTVNHLFLWVISHGYGWLTMVDFENGKPSIKYQLVTNPPMDSNGQIPPGEDTSPVRAPTPGRDVDRWSTGRPAGDHSKQMEGRSRTKIMGKSWKIHGKSMKTPGEHGENGGFTWFYHNLKQSEIHQEQTRSNQQKWIVGEKCWLNQQTGLMNNWSFVVHARNQSIASSGTLPIRSYQPFPPDILPSICCHVLYHQFYIVLPVVPHKAVAEVSE